MRLLINCRTSPSGESDPQNAEPHTARRPQPTMGGRQSTATSSTPEHTAPLPHVKKKEALSLQKSRAKYLSEKLGLSETNLRTIGLGSREELVPNGTEVVLGEASDGGVFEGETIEEVVVVEVEDSEGGEGRDAVEEELITCQQAPRLRAYNTTRTVKEAAKADPGIKRGTVPSLSVSWG